MTTVVIIGGGALGRELHSWLLAIQSAGTTFAIAGYVDDRKPTATDMMASALPYLGTPDTVDIRDVLLAMAIASPSAKRAVAERLASRGGTFFSVVHPSAVVTHTATLDEGVVIGPNCYIASHARLEPLVLVNALCVVGHDTVLGEHSTISCQADITGGVTLGSGVFIGSGARILPGVEIGAGARIGAGSVVVRRVKPGQIMFAAPARVLS